ncbi:MAG: OsmC family peroxiredoxin, partial [Bifidobacterium breve]|nr:OsmC family peroxiredoxin [Bifidobacterium breve]MDU1289060.1 OsmC family peroxiredoxin [Bifidobacterium bifidum]
LSDEDADKLKERVTRHIDKGCTVKHTYVQETPVRMSVTVKH